ncbi:DNA-directed RNA polymerase subunit beta [bacterium Unc6]|nr:DNA-directed RNA polymerase subunit beta [bacterium Unc6]
MQELKSFAKIPEIMDLPHFLDIQTQPYEEFLQGFVPKNKRKSVGLQEVFEEFFPMELPDKGVRLEFLRYSLEKPSHTIEQCLAGGFTYASPLRARLRLRTGKREVVEEDVYICDIPLMMPTGSFIINGDERVVVSQLHRSSGVCFEESPHPSGKMLYIARIIPDKGSWMEFEFDINDLMYVHLDRRKKFYVTTLLRALGFETDADILKEFYPIEVLHLKDTVISSLVGRVCAKDIIHKKTQEKIVSTGESITVEMVSQLEDAGPVFSVFDLSSKRQLYSTLASDHLHTKEDALVEIYHKMRPMEPSTVDGASDMLKNNFFNKKRYHLGKVGRFILNRKLNMNVPFDNTALDKETIINVIKYLLSLRNGEGKVDDIDHLGNRRVKTVCELVQNQFRIGCARLERNVKDRMAAYSNEMLLPHNLVNSKIVSSVIKDFFARSQLCQFMDQINLLAELTHKRRLSALGPGGLSRERAGFQVRDVHHSHYGRICPIETPEGSNVGLIASLATYARINEFGFIQTPYRKVVDGKVTGKIEYLSADIEDQYVIAQANSKIDEGGKFLDERVLCRDKGNFSLVDPEDISYMDVSPKQIVSVAASLTPFFEHNDANRALMGSNMQRQAVPLLLPERALLSTGIEGRIAKDGGAVVIAKKSGKATRVESDRIVIDNEQYTLKKFIRSNSSTCINQRPLVKVGDNVKAGDIIADGPATDNGELALGRNILVAFMPWYGYNFEDAIVISRKLVSDDLLTSIHIEEFEVEARETRLGNEEITRDIPNVAEEALKNLDEEGIVHIGAEVSAGDVIVGKITPKGETELTPEEKLLRAIFGEKAKDVKDSSLIVPPGVEGTVVDIKVFSRKDILKGKKKKTLKIEEMQAIESIRKHYETQIQHLVLEKNKKVASVLLGKKLTQSIIDEETGQILISSGNSITKSDLKKIETESCDASDIHINNEKDSAELYKMVKIFDDQILSLSSEQKRQTDRIKRGDELPTGVLKRVIIYIASKKKVSVGDKLAGRHGNKGVIAKILPEEDMPFTADGTPIEMILNPLGVPSRMNVGQILETQLGWAAKALGIRFISPIFDGAKEEEIRGELKKAGLPEDGVITLYDGKTGQAFVQKISVGYLYMMKLIHLVDDKIHARAIGPYSLITQQPLGGKAQFGGQRLGEMEVWALEAYGAAHTLQEFLTIKSDDIQGRTKAYEAIVKGEQVLQPTTPESFNVLIKELQSLGLDIKIEKKKK